MATHTYHLVLVPAEAVLKIPFQPFTHSIVVPLPQTMLTILRYVHRAFGAEEQWGTGPC